METLSAEHAYAKSMAVVAQKLHNQEQCTWDCINLAVEKGEFQTIISNIDVEVKKKFEEMGYLIVVNNNFSINLPNSGNIVISWKHIQEQIEKDIGGKDD